MKYVLDSHTHSVASGHAYSTVHEMARAAADRGLSLLGITEHAPAMEGSCSSIYFANLKVMPRQLCGIEVLFGVELNILDFEGHVDLEERLLKRMDVVIASLHTPCIRAGSREENTNAYLRVMENPYVDVIGHPDDGRYPIDYEALVRAAGEHHVLLELNNSSLHPMASREGAAQNDALLLRLCKKFRVPILLGSDAHTQEDVGNFSNLAPILEAEEFPEDLIVNRSVEEYKRYINRCKRMAR